MFAGIGVGDIIDGDFVIIPGRVGHFGEFHAIKTLSHREDAVTDGIKGKILTHLGFVEIIFFLTHFLGVVVIVPGSYLEVAAVFVDYCLHLCNFFVDFLDDRAPYLKQKIFRAVDRLGHHVVGHVCAETVKSEQLRFLGTCLKNLADDRVVIIFA